MPGLNRSHRKTHQRPLVIIKEKGIACSLSEQLKGYDGNGVNPGSFGVPYCPAASALDNQSYLAEYAQRAADSMIEAERTDDLVESVQEICEVRGGIPRQILNFALEENLGQRESRLTEQQAFGLLGMQIVEDPGFGYSEQHGVAEV